VATQLAEPRAAADSEQQPALEPTGAPSAPPVLPGGVAHSCARCHSPMDSAQDWCLQCGAGAPGSLSGGGPSWRSAASVLGVLTILVAGAGTAAYAALSKGAGKARMVTATVAQVSPPATPPPAAGTPGASTPPTPNVGAPTTIKPILPLGRVKPPKIPLTAATPKAPAITTPATTTKPSTSSPTTTTPATTPSTSFTGGSNAASEQQPEAILLDTNAAATYNPNNYPASSFGDPSLAIDGEASTAWTAQVEPTLAPKMADGLVIDLKSAQKLSALLLKTSTPGMTVQVYGANGEAVPPLITDPAWVALSRPQVEKKRHVRIKLAHSTKAFRFVMLWISKAPAAFLGTAQAPGHVRVNELELFPAKKK